jgi:hypothetical protein
MVRLRNYRDGETFAAKFPNASDDDYFYITLQPYTDYDSWSPEALAGEEYSLLIEVEGMIFAVQNIDFE